MKKVSLLILLAIVLSTMLMAAVPTKMVRLTVINKSGYDVFIKLTGSAVTDAFYYLTIPSGDRDAPTIKVFTIMSDLYDRETWQCDGVKSSGILIVDGNIRLTFTPCGERLLKINWSATNYWGVLVLKRVAGEPRMEKVTYFRYLQYGDPDWAAAYLYNGFWTTGCTTLFWRSRTWRTPTGCAWNYQY